MLNKKSAVIAFIPVQHANRAGTNGEVQIPLKDVDFSKALVALPPWKIAEAIRARIKMKMEAKGKQAVYDYEPSGHRGGDAERWGEKTTMETQGTAESEEEAGFFSDTTHVPEGGVLH